MAKRSSAGLKKAAAKRDRKTVFLGAAGTIAGLLGWAGIKFAADHLPGKTGEAAAAVVNK